MTANRKLRWNFFEKLWELLPSQNFEIDHTFFLRKVDKNSGDEVAPAQLAPVERAPKDTDVH
jgi:hypothetical protein